MTAVLIDTNAYAAFKQGLPDAVDIVQRAPQLLLSSIVFGELLAGFAVGSYEEQNRHELQLFLASTRVTVVVADERTAAIMPLSTANSAPKVARSQRTTFGSQLQRSSTIVRSSASMGIFSRWMG
jgi:predicted nucleic acid-binding protein